MSERRQQTASQLQEKMLSRYGEDFHHRHNKYHLEQRPHRKTHPVQFRKNVVDDWPLGAATGSVRADKLEKIRKRLDNGRIH